MFKTEKIDGYAKCHLNPILVVKDFNERGTLKIDNTFMSNADVPTLALKGIVEEPKQEASAKSDNDDLKSLLFYS